MTRPFVAGFVLHARPGVARNPGLSFATPLGLIRRHPSMGTFADWKRNATIWGDEAVATNGVLFEQVMEKLGG